VTLNPCSASGIATAVRKRELQWSEGAEASIAALHTEQARLNAAITILDDVPQQPADERRLRGPLAGVPVLVKDVIDTADVRTTRGSALFRDRVPSRSADCIRRLEAAGAIVVGKANLHEFAWGLTSRNPTWGDVVNPRNPALTPGGSSGGNAAAVAAGLVPLGIATDTGGSVRIPAACCEIVGFKPSNGRIPMTGVFPLAPTLDCVGLMAASFTDCALAFSVLSGNEVPAPMSALKVAATDEELVGLLGAVGVNAFQTDRPRPPHETSVILPAEAWRLHRELLAKHAEQYDPNVVTKLRGGAKWSDAQYSASLAAVNAWRRSTAEQADYDVLVDRTLDIPVPAADVDEISVRDAFGRAARWVNILGWASLAIGQVQVVGPDDSAVLAVAAMIEPAVAGQRADGN
jgi:aspartyl-tRNA(Asn)/glutamyl-tRNA(Gln) amidotransferase subunit A